MKAATCKLGLQSLIKRRKGVENKFSHMLMQKRFQNGLLSSLVHTSLFWVLSLRYFDEK